jgi:hypothetical protein
MINLQPDCINFLENNAVVRDHLQKAPQSANDMFNIITTSMPYYILSA